MAAAEKNGLDAISLDLFFYGILRKEISLRILVSNRRFAMPVSTI
jgi:hypothetical protein